MLSKPRRRLGANPILERQTRCRVVKLQKALLDCLALGEFGPPPYSVHVTEVSLGHKLETFPGG